MEGLIGIVGLFISQVLDRICPKWADKRRIKVIAAIRPIQPLLLWPTGQDRPDGLFVTIINSGARPVQVSGCSIRFSDKSEFTLYHSDGAHRLPARLEDHGTIELYFTLSDLLKHVTGKTRCQPREVRVEDVEGAIYKTALPKPLIHDLTIVQ